MQPKLNNTKPTQLKCYHYVQFRNRNKEMEWERFHDLNFIIFFKIKSLKLS